MALGAYLAFASAGVYVAAAGMRSWAVELRAVDGAGWLITWAEPNGPAYDLGLRRGDVVLAADGRTLASPSEIDVATNLLVEVDGGQRQVSWSQLGGPTRTGFVALGATGVCFALAGALVFLVGRNRFQARAFAWLCAVLAIGLAGVPAGSAGQSWAVRLVFAGTQVGMVAFGHFLAVFPWRDGKASRRVRAWFWLTPVLCAATLGLYAVALVANPSLFPLAEQLGFVSLMAGCLGAVAVGIRSYRRAPTERARQQLKIVAGGIALGALPLVALSGVSGEAIHVDPRLSVLATGLIPFSMAYAVLKPETEIIRADIVARRATIYLSVLVVITTAYLLTLSTLQAAYQYLTGHASAISPVVAALPVALTVDWVRRMTQAGIERLFFTDVRTYRRLLAEATRPGIRRMLDLDALAANLVGRLAQALGRPPCAFYVAERPEGAYTLRWPASQYTERPVLPPRHPAWHLLSGERRAVLLDEPLSLSAGFAARLLVPFRVGERTVAVAALGDRPDGEPYAGADVEFLETAAKQWAVLFDNAKMHEDVRRQAITDPLTGLANRHALLQQLETAIAAARSRCEPVSVLLIDVDGFKSFNDDHGHLVGDDVLVAIGRRLRGACRLRDTVGRYGGDEFMVVLPGADASVAGQLAERLAQAVADEPLEVSTGERLALSISVGRATFPESGDSPEQLVAAADVAMYGHKRSRRPRREKAPGEDLAPPLRSLAAAIRQQNPALGAHSERTAVWSERLGEALGLSNEEVRALRAAALLHHLGCLSQGGAPDRGQAELLGLFHDLPECSGITACLAGAGPDGMPWLGATVLAVADRYDTLLSTGLHATLALDQLAAEAGGGPGGEVVVMLARLAAPDPERALAREVFSTSETRDHVQRLRPHIASL